MAVSREVTYVGPMPSLVVRVLVGAAAVFALVAAAAAPASHAYNLGGKKWPTRTITYHSSAPQFGFAIKAAVQAWNTSGVRIRFRPAPKHRAKLLIGYSERSDGAPGRAVLGWVPVQRVTEKTHGGVPLIGNVPCGLRLPLPNGHLAPVRCFRKTQRPRMWLKKVRPAVLRDPVQRNFMEQTAAHELGHVLGLHHVRRACAIMSDVPGGGCPAPPNEWQARCRLLEADDVRGAIRRYGGRMRPLAPDFCDMHTPPEPVIDLAARFDPATRSVTATWRNPPAGGTRYVSMAVGLDVCPTELDYLNSQRVEPGTPGSATTEIDDGEGGRYCVALRTIDDYDRQSAPATVWIDVPPGEPANEGGGSQRDPVG